MASHRSTTQALNLKQTSQITNRQAVKTNRQAGNMFSTLPDRTDCFCGSGSRIGIHITLDKPPSPVICHLFHTTKMTGTHKKQLIDHLRVFLVLLSLIFYMIFSRHRRQQNPHPHHRQTNMSPNKIYKHMSGNGLTN